MAAARRADAVASLAPLWLEGVDQEAVGAESRRSLHPVVRPALYVMSRVGCRPLRCAAADSNRLRPALALPGAIHVAWLQLFGLLPPWCTPDGDSPRTPLSLGESVCPVRRLEGDVELAALAGELVDRATQNGDVDGRLQLDLAQRVALRLLRWRSPLLSYSPL